MQITFFGAAESVTGSCHLLQVKDKNILLDCGLYQGEDENKYGNDKFNFNPKDIDFLILSHAHMDHSGRIPLLYASGFRGKIVCTKGTCDLCNIMLADSSHIQDMETNFINKERLKLKKDPIKPLYSLEDIDECMNLFTPYPYSTWIELFEGFKIRFKDAGHLLGSAITEMVIKEDEKECKIVYSGDLGNTDKPILKDPSNIDSADYVIMESTYGDKIHKDLGNDFSKLLHIIEWTFKEGGNVVIPCFSIGRTQEILYALNKFVESHTLENIKVYVDSPLAYRSTEIFNKYKNYYDIEASKLLLNGDNPLDFKGLIFTKSTEESMKINNVKNNAVIISASGMCESGRIKHHLKYNLPRKESSIVFMGYQAYNTLGYKILHGDKIVNIFNKDVEVNAKIFTLEGLSGHADKEGLLNWINAFKEKPKNIFLVHGDLEAKTSLKESLENQGYTATIVESGNSFIPN